MAIASADILTSGAIQVSFSDGLDAAYHPDRLFGTAWSGEDTIAKTALWTAADLLASPTFDGPDALNNPEVFLQ